jgi:streptomycin 6-kinase
MSSPILAGRAEGLAREWRLTVTRVEETPRSLLAFGHRGGVPVVLKVFRQSGDESHSTAVLQAFRGRGTVEVLDYREGAVLLEMLSPGTPLADLTAAGRDDEATETLAETVQQLADAKATVDGIPTVEDWGRGYAAYLKSSDSQLDRELVERARICYEKLSASQQRPRVLHGDLHHHNILRDSRRGWVAIDPKGVRGEIEYEFGASFRNPEQSPAFYTAPGVVEERLRIYSARLHLDPERILAWAYAQAVLSAIWLVEDGIAVAPDAPPIHLARTIESILQPGP